MYNEQATISQQTKFLQKFLDNMLTNDRFNNFERYLESCFGTWRSSHAPYIDGDKVRVAFDHLKLFR